MDSYLPTMSTPCKCFLDLLVCIQRGAAKIVVLADGLDHIIPPHTPPWHLLFFAPIVDCSFSPSQPFIIHVSSTHHLPCTRGQLRCPFPTSPFMLSPALLHTWEKTPSEHLQSHHTALLEALLCPNICRNPHSRAALHPARSRCSFTPARAVQSFVTCRRLCGSAALSGTWSSRRGGSPTPSQATLGPVTPEIGWCFTHSR